MKLTPLIQPELTWVFESVDSKQSLIEQMTRRIAEHVGQLNAEALQSALCERESQGPTSTPEAVAFPHAMLDDLTESFVAVCLVKGGVDFGHPDHPPCDLIFLLVGPRHAAWEHLSVLARLARICHTPGALEAMRAAGDGQALCSVICQEDDRHG